MLLGGGLRSPSAFLVKYTVIFRGLSNGPKFQTLKLLLSSPYLKVVKEYIKNFSFWKSFK